MQMEQIKNNKGITLVALTIYIVVFVLVLGVMTTISTSFFSNLGGAVDTPKYTSEFNKFAMFFVTDAKNYSKANVTDTTIQFENGPTYKYENNNIYRNDNIIAENIINCKFTAKEYNVDSTVKNIINASMQIGKTQEKSIVRSVDFTLRYW